MTLYNVHLYREVRLFFGGIEASTPEEAAAMATHLDTADADFLASCDRANLAAHVAIAGEDFSTAVSIDFKPQPDIHQLLKQRRQIADIWSIEDVQQVRPDLTEDQAWAVLQEVDRHKDAELGISWLTLEIIAEDLFGDAPETGDDGRQP